MNNSIIKMGEDHLLPSLFDRLTDLEPQKKSEVKSNPASMDIKEYKSAVLRDMVNLLNTNVVSDMPYSGLEYVEKSSVNYGIMSLSGANVSEIDWTMVEDNIKESIKNFEPRIAYDTLEVNCVVGDKDTLMSNQLVIEIKGLLLANPFPQDILFRTSLDVETGFFNLLTN